MITLDQILSNTVDGRDLRMEFFKWLKTFPERKFRSYSINDCPLTIFIREVYKKPIILAFITYWDNSEDFMANKIPHKIPAESWVEPIRYLIDRNLSYTIKARRDYLGNPIRFDRETFTGAEAVELLGAHAMHVLGTGNKPYAN